MSDYAEELRRIAQNDYMIDGEFLPDGKLLNEIADDLDYLRNMSFDRKMSNVMGYLFEELK
jgi:hypothetical protein